jgi:hypothetical protein
MATTHCRLAVSMSQPSPKGPGAALPALPRSFQALEWPPDRLPWGGDATQLEPLVLQYTRILGSRFMQGLAMPCDDACAVDSGLLVH